MGRGKGRADYGRETDGRNNRNYQAGSNNGSLASPDGASRSLTVGQRGLDTHAVAESTRITLDRQLRAFRDDEEATSLAFPPALDHTSRKFIHEAVKRLGLESKSRGKGSIAATSAAAAAGAVPNGDARFITVSKKRTKTPGNGDRAELPPLLRLGRTRDEALDTYFSRYRPTERELETVMATAGGRGMNAAADLVTQKRHKAGLRDRQARAIASAGASPEELQRRAHTYSMAQTKREKAAGYKRTAAFREELPSWSYRDAILDMVRDHQVCLVSGETGCGKSTQVPQFVLDDPRTGQSCKIVCTQPRRISAIAVAERIADERGEAAGGKVGYTIRLESSVSKDTQLILMTPGILLKKLGNDPMLKEFTHVLIDEVHERDRNSEFLLIVLRDLVPKRPDLRLVLMSATLQQGKYTNYFGGCPIVTIGARTFPVQAFFLEDVLIQTKYLEEIGVANDGDDLLGVNGLLQLEDGEEEAFECNLCGKSGFRSAQELGTHAAMCFGTAGLDPALEGLTDEGLELLVAGASGVGYTQVGGKQTLRSLSPPAPRIEVGDDLELDAPDDDFDLGSLSDGISQPHVAALGAEVETMTDYVASDEATVKDHGTGGGGVAESGDGGRAGRVEDEETDASIGTGPEEEEELVDEVAAEEDDMDRGLHDALAMSQRWDGRGTFRGERASATSGRPEALLTKYQFAFDDESVDFELIECLLRYICRSAYEDGAVLVFLPGWDDITRLGDFLRQSPRFSDENKFQILPLHSGVPTAKQRQVFARPPKGCRKIVLSTNIAETSITIDDVAFVIDSGRAKESSYDPHLKIKTLVPQWVSKASARQRRGRAGRTKAGVCFHLFSARRHESLRDFQESELLRTPLEEVVLQAKMLGLANGGPGDPNSAAGFLSQAIDPPPELSLRNAVQLLQGLGALDEQEELTDLGARLAGISIDPRVGKMVLWSYLLGCAGPALTAACAMTYKDPFVLPMNAAQKREAKAAKLGLSQGSESDVIALLRALEGHAEAKAQGGVGAAAALARRNHLSSPTLGMIWDICGQVARELMGLGLPAAYDWNGACNRNDRDVSLLSSVLCAGLYPNVALRRPGSTNFTTLGGHTAKLHVSSINAARNQRLGQLNIGKQTEFIAFGELTRTANNFVMSNTTPVSPLALLLLCGNLKAEELYPTEGGEDFDNDEGELCDNKERAAGSGGGPAEILLELDGWVRFRLPADQGRYLLVLRNRLQSTFAHHMQSNGRPPSGAVASDAVITAHALLHEPSVAEGAAAAAAASMNNRFRGHGGGRSHSQRVHGGRGGGGRGGGGGGLKRGWSQAYAPGGSSGRGGPRSSGRQSSMGSRGRSAGRSTSRGRGRTRGRGRG